MPQPITITVRASVSSRFPSLRIMRRAMCVMLQKRKRIVRALKRADIELTILAT